MLDAVDGLPLVEKKRMFGFHALWADGRIFAGGEHHRIVSLVAVQHRDGAVDDYSFELAELDGTPLADPRETAAQLATWLISAVLAGGSDLPAVNAKED